MTKSIELDARRRTSLGRIGHKEHTRYIADEKPDGTIVLTPAVMVPLTAEALKDAYEKSLREAAEGKLVPYRP